MTIYAEAPTFFWDEATKLIDEYRESEQILPEFDWVDEDECFELAIAHNGYNIQFVKEQTDDLIYNALLSKPLSLKYIINQTEEYCMLAVEYNGLALKHARIQTREICMMAIKNNPMALMFVDEQDPDIVEYALELDPCAIGYVKHKTPKMCMDAIDRDPEAFLRIYKPSPELCLHALRQDYRLFGNVDFTRIPEGVIKEQLKVILTQALLSIPKNWTRHDENTGNWYFYGLSYDAGYEAGQDDI